MVVAYLRGVLPQRHRYGLRSIVSEDVILEHLNAEAVGRNIEAAAMVDLALLPVLTPKGVRDVATKAAAKLGRAAELRLMDIFRVGEQVAGKLKLANASGELSLFQVYQMAEKSGIFEAFDEHYTEENSRPLL